MTTQFNKRHGAFPTWIKVAFVSLALVKLWLVSGQTLVAYSDQLFDDRLFISLADSLLSGHWLGPYNKLTLAKGPFYPMWVAAVFLIGIPLLLAQHLLYIAACTVFIIAIRPILSRRMLFLIWIILLFNPMSYSKLMMMVRREGIYPALTVLVAAGAIGILARYDRPLKKLLPWTILLGFSLSAFWLTREEGIWIMPSILVIVGFAAAQMLKIKPNHWRFLIYVCILPFFIWMIVVVTVAGINKVRYGLFTTVEVKSSDFLAAYGALSRVKHVHWQPHVPKVTAFHGPIFPESISEYYYPVPKETRERIYKISPAFAELSPFLEGNLGAKWRSASCGAASLCDDIGGGWFMWALRDAVSEAGYHSSAASAANYYHHLATDVNSACVRGQIECGGERASMMPPWHREYARPLLNTFLRGIVFLSRFEGFQARSDPSTGTEESLLLFRDLTNSRISSLDSAENIKNGFLPNQLRMDNFKISILERIGRAYQTIVPLLIVIALISYLINTIKMLRTRTSSSLWMINTAFLIAIVVRLFILSLLDVTSFRGINSRYLFPLYPLLLIFIILALNSFLSSSKNT